MNKLLKFIFLMNFIMFIFVGVDIRAAAPIISNTFDAEPLDGVKNVFNNWINDINEKHDLSKYYADRLIYYRYKEYPKSLIIRDKNLFYKKYNAIAIGVSAESVRFNPDGTYTISYLKSYSATSSNRRTFISGYARSVVTFKNQYNNWLITDEHDIKSIKPRIMELGFRNEDSQSDRHEIAEAIAQKLVILAIYNWMADEEKIPAENRLLAINMLITTLKEFRSIDYPYYDDAWIQYVHGYAISSCKDMIMINGVSQQPPVEIIINKIDKLFVGFLSDSLMNDKLKRY